jgi:formate hydrogenlyase subunit 3/multisubunit Na+/H+ antiporter MnhD subunit
MAKKMPKTAVFTLLGVMTISAIPLTNGFFSEFNIFKAALEASDG